MRHICPALTGLVLLALTGCTMFGSDGDAEADYLIDRAGARKLGYALGWQYNLALPPNQHISDAKVHDDLIVLIEEPGNVVWAVSTRDGAQQWGTVVGKPMQPLYSSVRWNNNIYVNSGTVIYTLNAGENGAITATHRLAQAVASGPVRYDNLAIFGAVSGRVFAHRLEVGRPLWAYQLTDQIRVTPILVDDRVFAVDGSGVYVMLLARQGPSAGGAIYQNYTFGAVSARPTTDGEWIYLASEDRKLYKLHPYVNESDWEYAAPVPLTESPMVIGDLVVQPMGERGMIALRKSNKEVVWRLDYQAVPILERDGRLLLSTGHSLQLIDAQSGQLIEECATQPIAKILEGPEDSLILVAEDGRLRRLNRLP